MKPTSILALIILIIFSGCEPELQSVNKVTQPPAPSNKNTVIITTGCNYNKSSDPGALEILPPGAREENQIRSILTHAGLPVNFDIYAANIDNAAAIVIDNRRVILYDKRWLNFVDQNSNSYWTSMSILAHEIGHHLSGHTLQIGGSNNNIELEADKFSGFVLQKMGASLSQAQHAMSILASEYSSPSHPGKALRLDAIRRGWEEANKLRHNAAIPPPPEDIINPVGGTDEFNTEHLINAPSYSFIKAQSGHGFGISDKMDGIILETDADHYYSILVTRTSTDDRELMSQTITVQMYDPWESYDPLGRAQYSWLDAIMVPGRRIRFAFWGEGTADVKHFVYVKSLPGDQY